MKPTKVMQGTEHPWASGYSFERTSVMTILCRRCGAKAQFTDTSDTGNIFQARRAGWQVGHSRCLCPECNARPYRTPKELPGESSD